MKRWLFLSLVTLFIWGFWGLFANLAFRYLDHYSAMFWESDLFDSAQELGGLQPLSF